MSCQKCGSTDTYCGCDEATAIAERDAALAELAALKKRLADAERVRTMPYMSDWTRHHMIPCKEVSAPSVFALVPLTEDEA
jgi:hypothetical protein